MAETTLDAFVKTENGTIYQVLQHANKKGIALLRLKNKYIEMSFKDLRQRIVDGVYSDINEHEHRKWVKEDHEYMMNLSNKLAKRVFFSQLLLELDDSLEADFEDNKYFKNVIQKSKKQCERLIGEHYDKMYDTDKTYVTNFMNHLDEFATKCASLKVPDFVHLNKVLDKYKENPEPYQDKTVTIKRLDS